LVGAVAGAGEQIIADGEGVTLAGEAVWGFYDALAELCEGGFGEGFLALARAGQRGHDGRVAAHERPVGGVDAVLATGGRVDLGDLDAGRFEGLANFSVLGDGLCD